MTAPDPAELAATAADDQREGPFGETDYRIDFTITRRQPGEDDFIEIGFGSSGGSNSVDEAVHIVASTVQNREWETTPQMPDPEETKNTGR